MTTTLDDPRGGSRLANSTNSASGNRQEPSESDSTSKSWQYQQQAKELTEKAANTSDPDERESLIRQALDYEVQSRLHHEIDRPSHDDAVPVITVEEELKEAFDLGPDALTGPLLDLTSPEILRETLAEVAGDLNAVGGLLFNFDEQLEAKDVAGKIDADDAYFEQLEAALPAIEEILGETNVSRFDSEDKSMAEGEPGASAEVILEAADEPATPSDESGSVTVTEDSIDDEQSSQLQSPASESVATLETTKITVAKTEIVEEGSKPRKKPNKLEIRSKKKQQPRKLEIRSERAKS